MATNGSLQMEPIVNKKLEGKVAIITGAATGIGAAVARLFAAHGAKVIVADIAEEKGRELVAKIGPSAHYRQCDVTKEKDIADTVDFALEKYGKLDIYHSNAGVATPFEDFQNIDMDKYDRYTSIMVRGVVAGIKHAARAMVPAKKGVILSTGSTATLNASDVFPLIYNMNKSNLPGITKAASYNLGKHGIRVNTISPHGVLTEMAVKVNKDLGFQGTFEDLASLNLKYSNIAGRRCLEEDIANGALFLCSEDGGYVSGQNLVIDGGFSNVRLVNMGL